MVGAHDADPAPATSTATTTTGPAIVSARAFAGGATPLAVARRGRRRAAGCRRGRRGGGNRRGGLRGRRVRNWRSRGIVSFSLFAFGFHDPSSLTTVLFEGDVFGFEVTNAFVVLIRGAGASGAVEEEDGLGDHLGAVSLFAFRRVP